MPKKLWQNDSYEYGKYLAAKYNLSVHKVKCKCCMSCLCRNDAFNKSWVR